MKIGFIALVMMVWAAGSAMAQTIEERITESLQAQGYAIVTMHRTWLGRIRVIAESNDLHREMVFNPSTGEVLRDYVTALVPEDSENSLHAAVRDDDDSDREDSGSGAAAVLGPETEAGTTTEVEGSIASPESDAIEGSEGLILVDPVVIDVAD